MKIALLLFFLLSGLVNADSPKGPLTPHRVRVSPQDVNLYQKIVGVQFFFFPGDDEQHVQAVIYASNPDYQTPMWLIAISSPHVIRAHSHLGWRTFYFADPIVVDTFEYQFGLLARFAARPASVALDPDQHRFIGDGFWQPKEGQYFGMPHIKMPWGVRAKVLYQKP